MTDRQFVVTGGTGGIGAAVVERLLADGADVTVTFRDDEKLQHLMERVGDRAAALGTVRTELTDPDSVAALVAQCGNDPRLDGVVAMAGGWVGGHPLWETTPDDLERAVALNITSTFLPLRALLPRMIEAGHGRVITVGSRLTHQGRKNNAVQAATKAAVETLTLALADELKGTGVSAYSIQPAMVATPSNLAAFPKANHDRWVTPEAIAAVVAWLLSDDAGIANGAIVPVWGDS
jgi:NAD(P)-dependent dehydrogenase (short-subunit alcohol dehydrogenase family)